MFIESLERRQLLSAGATYDLATHTVFVTGTNGDDQISAGGSGWGTAATVNGVTSRFMWLFDYIQVDRIVIDGLAGNDHIAYSDDRGAGLGVRQVLIRGGAGDDTIDATYEWTPNLLIDAGKGNDTISYAVGPHGTYGGNVSLLGGNGDDIIDVHRFSDTQLLADGGNGNDRITVATVEGAPPSIPATCIGGRGNDILTAD
jgi:hypothetical protein